MSKWGWDESYDLKYKDPPEDVKYKKKKNKKSNKKSNHKHDPITMIVISDINLYEDKSIESINFMVLKACSICGKVYDFDEDDFPDEVKQDNRWLFSCLKYTSVFEDHNKFADKNSTIALCKRIFNRDKNLILYAVNNFPIYFDSNCKNDYSFPMLTMKYVSLSKNMDNIRPQLIYYFDRIEKK